MISEAVARSLVPESVADDYSLDAGSVVDDYSLVPGSLADDYSLVPEYPGIQFLRERLKNAPTLLIIKIKQYYFLS